MTSNLATFIYYVLFATELTYITVKKKNLTTEPREYTKNKYKSKLKGLNFFPHNST